jgi:hypothetical protein
MVCQSVIDEFTILMCLFRHNDEHLAQAHAVTSELTAAVTSLFRAALHQADKHGAFRPYQCANAAMDAAAAATPSVACHALLGLPPPPQSPPGRGRGGPLEPSRTTKSSLSRASWATSDSGESRWRRRRLTRGRARPRGLRKERGDGGRGKEKLMCKYSIHTSVLAVRFRCFI